MSRVEEFLRACTGTTPRPPETSVLMKRRVLMASLVIVTIVAMTGLMASTLSRGGYGILDVLLTICFLVTLPWTAVGFWNAVIGLAIMRTSSDPVRAVCPGAVDGDDEIPISGRTALLMCIRNEDAHAVYRNLDIMIGGLAERGMARHFHAFVLSDSSWGEVVDEEPRIFQDLAERWRGIVSVTYRRRAVNDGFKAGNIRDFCDRWGGEHDYALVLDADSLMAADTILRLVRTMEQRPEIGILQNLIVGAPTVSPFARVFQFGMRLGMQSYTLGSAWWQGDCGPYWGHNAIIRLRPFIEHCHLPQLPGGPPLGGWILSHDQVEAVLMRRAGLEVRVLAQEGGSWEENPPTLLEFIRRDLRWCQGNMQYWHLLGMPGLILVSRVQLALAMLMFVGSPAWLLFMTLVMLRVGLTEDSSQLFNPETGVVLLAAILVMIFAPKIATLIDLLIRPERARAFGGRPLAVFGFLGEVVFSALLAPVMALAHTRFLLGLPFGRAALWSPQRRASHQLGLSETLGRLWPQTLFGVSALVWLKVTEPAALVGFLPFLAGLVLAAGIASTTSNTALGRMLAGAGMWRIPEETSPAPEFLALNLPALREAGAGTRPSRRLQESEVGE